MARLPEGKQRIAFGCYYEMKPGKGLTINTSINIKWYGWPLLMWKLAHEDYFIKRHEYPRIICLIAKHSIMKWIGKG